MGRLTADPELKTVGGNTSVVHFTIAINSNYKNKNTGEQRTDFIRCTAWRTTAEFISKYFTKGKMMIVEGSLRSDNYTDNNGIKRYSLEVYADNVSFGESKASESKTINNMAQQAYAAQSGQVNNQTVNNGSAINTKGEVGVSAMNEDINSQLLGNLQDFEEILSDGEVPF